MCNFIIRFIHTSREDKSPNRFQAHIHAKKKWVLAIVSYNKLGATSLHQHLQSGNLDDFVRRGEMMYFDTPADDQDDLIYYLVEAENNKLYLYVELDPNEPWTPKTPLCTVPTSLTLEELSKIYPGHRLVEENNTPIKLDNVHKLSFLDRVSIIFRLFKKNIFIYLIATGILLYLLLILF